MFTLQCLLRELWMAGTSPRYLLVAEGRHDGGVNANRLGGWPIVQLSRSPAPSV